MTKLTTQQLVYLLYASAYAEGDTVTKGTVKSNLPGEWKEKAEKIYDVLQTQGLIKQVSKGRFSIETQGIETLVTNLATTDYKFTSVKGPKVLNALLAYVKKAAEIHPLFKYSVKMTFDEFQDKFKSLYFEERNRQELRGVVAIHSEELRQQFIEQYSISPEELGGYFDLLKSTGKIFSVTEKGSELIQWVE